MTTPFAIASLPVGTGQLALCPLPGRTGTLEADLNAIRASGAELLLSLTEPGELRRLGVCDLHQAFDARGFLWRGFPIPDFGIPASDAAWSPLSLLAHDVMGHGGSVLIHCHGGLGRSGMIALRLMVERGEEPVAALTRLRTVRPGAVEIEAQFDWATRLAP